MAVLTISIQHEEQHVVLQLVSNLCGLITACGCTQAVDDRMEACNKMSRGKMKGTGKPYVSVMDRGKWELNLTVLTTDSERCDIFESLAIRHLQVEGREGGFVYWTGSCSSVGH
jgi:hypothetical protein